MEWNRDPWDIPTHVAIDSQHYHGIPLKEGWSFQQVVLEKKYFYTERSRSRSRRMNL